MQELMPSDDKPFSVETREGYFVQYAELLRPHLKLSRIVVTGGFQTAHGMADAISRGAADSKCHVVNCTFFSAIGMTQ